MTHYRIVEVPFVGWEDRTYFRSERWSWLRGWVTIEANSTEEKAHESIKLYSEWLVKYKEAKARCGVVWRGQG